LESVNEAGGADVTVVWANAPPVETSPESKVARVETLKLFKGIMTYLIDLTFAPPHREPHWNQFDPIIRKPVLRKREASARIETLQSTSGKHSAARCAAADHRQEAGKRSI
jgi:hypothetical protein